MSATTLQCSHCGLDWMELRRLLRRAAASHDAGRPVDATRIEQARQKIRDCSYCHGASA